MKHRRTFEYVAFWDEVAWVAGTTGYNDVQQGQTLVEAVDRLRFSLYLHAVWAGNDRRPFAVIDETRAPMDSFRNSEGAITCEPGQEQQGVRYRGYVEVEWTDKQVAEHAKKAAHNRKKDEKKRVR